MASPPEVVPGNAQQEAAGYRQGAEEGVRDCDEGGVVGENGPGVGHDRAAVDHFHADGMLHPAVGHDDEIRGEHGSHDGNPEAGQVDSPLELLPAEDPQPQEGGFHEEGQQCLERQRRPEHVTDEAAVLAPRHPELELLHDAGGDAHDEVDQEELPPELGHAQVLRLAGAVPDRLDDCHHEAQPDGQRDHHEVVNGGDSELPACDFQSVQGSPYFWLGFHQSQSSTLRRKLTSTECRTLSACSLNNSSTGRSPWQGRGAPIVLPHVERISKKR
ncbi:hypothetical protein D9M72_274480 [compost metagenome]